MKNRLSALMIWILVAVLSMGTAGSAFARHDQMQNGQSSEGDPSGGMIGVPEYMVAGGAAQSSMVAAPEQLRLSSVSWHVFFVGVKSAIVLPGTVFTGFLEYPARRSCSDREKQLSVEASESR